MAYRHTEDKRAYQRQYKLETARFYMSRQRCRQCGAQDAFTLAGRSYCQTCAERRREMHARRRARRGEEMNALARERRHAYAAAGRCTTCGKVLPDDNGGLLTCPSCRANGRERQRKNRRDAGIIPRAERAGLGLCYLCGKPSMDRELQWKDKKAIYCEECYQKSREALSRARAAFQRQRGMTYGDLCWHYEHLQRIGGEADGGKADA